MNPKYQTETDRLVRLLCIAREQSHCGNNSGAADAFDAVLAGIAPALAHHRRELGVPIAARIPVDRAVQLLRAAANDAEEFNANTEEGWGSRWTGSAAELRATATALEVAAADARAQELAARATTPTPIAETFGGRVGRALAVHWPDRNERVSHAADTPAGEWSDWAWRRMSAALRAAGVTEEGR